MAVKKKVRLPHKIIFRMGLDASVRLRHHARMKLAEYMAFKKLPDAKLAAKLGCSRSSVTKYRLGTMTPPLATIAEIERITDYAVSFRDFLPVKTAR